MPEREKVPQRFRIDFEPIGRRVEAEPDQSLLDVVRSAGIDLVSICGGDGSCAGCRVRPLGGKLSAVTLSEQAELGESDLAQGYRLACQVMPLSDLKVEIPPESLATPQRLQLEGEGEIIPTDPVVEAVDLEIDAPALADLRADTRRVNDALIAQGGQAVQFDLALLGGLSDQLRAEGWKPRLAVRGTEAVALLAQRTPLLGLAVDIGTTKIAAYLVDLQSGMTLAKAGAMNPQISFGEDVISRIAYVNEHGDGRLTLQTRVIGALNALLSDLCAQGHARPEQVVEASVVGNTAMHHLFLGLPVRQLGAAPYLAEAGEALEVRARDVGLGIAPGGTVYLPPNIAGFVGADHVSMLLATGVWKERRTVIALDIGTNTEITLAHEGRLRSCSCASGPAFEGAHIVDGMRAAPGAIERVQILGSDVRVFAIGNVPPVGLCGSGILDAAAQMLEAKVIDARGVFAELPSRIIEREGEKAFVLVPAKDSGNGRDVVVTRRDISEIQLAKGAIRAGMEVLLQEAGIAAGDLDEIVVAGAFGTYLDVRSAIRVGMFPGLPQARFRQVGNAAGMGAKRMLVSRDQRRAADEIVRRVEYVELTTHPSFVDKFMQCLYFPEAD